MRKLVIFVCGFAAAIGILVYFLDGVDFILPLMSAVSAALLFFFRRKWLRRIAILLLGLTVGFLWCSFYTNTFLRPTESLCGEEIVFSAVAVDYSEPAGSRNCVTADLLVDGRDVRANLFYADDIRLAPGDFLQGTAAFRTTVDGDFYDISRGVYLIGTASEGLLVNRDAYPSFRGSLLKITRRLQENLKAALPEESAGYFIALTTGDRSGMSYAFRQRLAVSGLYHAVSLSGMHISILMSVFILFCFGRKRLAAVLGIPVILLFSLMSGASPATLRAVCMQAVLLVTLFIDREYDSLTSLSLALLILLLQNPWALTHWGLQLSFASTAGILLLMPCFMKVKIRSRVLRALLMPVFVTLSATVFSAPLMCLYFGMNSLVAPLTNLLALWSVTVSFVGGIFLSILGFVSVPLAGTLGKVLHLLYVWLRWVTQAFSSVFCAAVYRQTPLVLVWSYLTYVLTATAILKKVKWFVPVICILGMLATALCFTPKLPEGITVQDVGQGQCVLLHTQDGNVLVDCGGNGNETGEETARFLLSHGITKLDAVVITHFDTDHCDGVLQLLDRIPAGALYFPKMEEGSEIVASANCLLQPVTEPINLRADDMEITIYPAIGGKNDNDTGVCVLASCRECDILITGDLRKPAEARLVTVYDLPDLEVLVAGHHGSKDATGEALLERLRPETVLISVGENRYDHPHQETLDRIAASGAVAYLTKENGNLTVRW